MSDEIEVPESREVLFHEFRTEMTKLEREALEKFREENIQRWTRMGELDEFFTALKSHESIDGAWLEAWQERVGSVMKGEPR